MLHITPGERDVLRLLADGATSAGIAGHLGIGVSDVEAFVGALMNRMGAVSEAGLVAAARRRGLLDSSHAAALGITTV
jgi:DNA-binding CsgD family transcriptional regulator